MDLDIDRIINDLSNIYWEEIDRDNPSYVYAFDKIKELCNKYGVIYRTSKEDILHDFVGEETNKTNLLKEIKGDIESTTSKEIYYSFMDKYSDIKENWRKSIYGYVKNYSQLSGLLRGYMEQISQQLSDFEPREERLKPKIVYDYGDFIGFDENEESRIENESEVQARVAQEDKIYEQKKENFENMKASLPKWMEYLTVLPEISSLYNTLEHTLNQFAGMGTTFLLDDFAKDLDFINQLDEIMKHDKTQYEYLYHGTTCVEDAHNILEQGLYMSNDDIYSTTYSEFDRDTFLLYNRGFLGEIGSSIVIIKRPVEENIVREVTKEDQENCQAVSSGLSGLNTRFDYIIPKEYIVGYVDKANKEVVYQKDLSLEHSTGYVGN